MSRQGLDNYRKVALSNIRTITVSPDDLFIPEIPNLKPEGALISPRPSDTARASAYITETTVQNQDDYGQIKYIRMDNIGSNYDPELLPTVVLQGGGGTGAAASAVLVDGAISDLFVQSFGKGYEYGESEDTKDWIVPVDPNRRAVD